VIHLALLLAALGAAPAEPQGQEEGTPPASSAPAAPAAPAPASPAPASPAPEQPQPDPCRAPTGSVQPRGCSPTPEAPPDPSQPQSKREEAPPKKREGWIGWADARHEAFEQSLFGLVLRADGFFGDPSHIQFDPPAYSLRLRSGLRVGQDSLTRAEGSVLADIRLPSLERAVSRASLYIAGGADEDQLQSSTEQDLAPLRVAPSIGASHGALELRFDLFRAKRTVVDLGGGVRFGYPIPYYTRLRLAHAEDLGLGLVGAVNQTGFWDSTLGFGESTRADVERVFGPRSIARMWGIGTLHEKSRGLEWTAEVGFAQGLGVRTGLYTAASAQGATRPADQVDKYRVYTRLRRDIHNAWLFAELEPEVQWPLLPSGARPRFYAVTLRLELQFATRAR